MENEQADAGRDGQTRLARPKFLGVNGNGNINFPVQLTTNRIGDLTRLIHTPLYVRITIQTNNSIVGVRKKRRTLIGPW